MSQPTSTLIIPTTRLSFHQVIELAWKYFKANWQKIILFTAIFYLPINYILAQVQITESSGWMKQLEYENSYFRLVALLDNTIGAFATLSILYTVRSSLEGKILDVSAALKMALASWWRLFKTNLRLGISLSALFILLIIPSVIYYVYWAFTIMAVVFDDLGGQKALDESKSLVSGKWWSVAGFLLGCLFLQITMVALVGWLGTVLVGVLPTLAFLEPAINLIYDVLDSFFLIALAIYYLNLKSWKETQLVPQNT